MAPRPQRICVARIGAPHGVRGEVKLWSYTDDPLAIANYGPLETEDGAARFEIEALRPAKDHLVAQLAGVTDRDAAARLTNTDLFVRREQLPALEANDEFYHADLVGLSAVARDGAVLGIVSAIHNFGAGDLLEVTPARGGAAVLLPFTEATVPEVDIAGKRVFIDAAAFAAAAAPESAAQREAK